MPSETTYKGIPVITPDPTGQGGLILHNATKELANRIGPSHKSTSAPTTSHDGVDTAGLGISFEVNSRWIKTSGGSEEEFVCLSNATGAAVWASTTAAGGGGGTDKADKVSGAIAGNFAGLASDGNLIDSGYDPTSFAAQSHVHDDRYYTESEMDSALAGKVGSTRTINTTAPLSGGGDLSADRTITISAASALSAGSMSTAHFTLVNDATNLNTVSTLVKRDAGGSFAAGTITSTALTTGAITATSITNNISTQKIVVRKAGSTIGTRKQINFIEGANVSLTVADDGVNDEVDVTIAVTGSGGGGILGLDGGGTGSDLSSSGGTGYVLKQESFGAAITSSVLSASDIPSHTHAYSEIDGFDEAAMDAAFGNAWDSSTVDVDYDDSGGYVQFNVVPESSLQKVKLRSNGTEVGDYSNLNFTAGTGLTMSVYAGSYGEISYSVQDDTTVQKVDIGTGGSVYASRRFINLIPGSNISYVITDDSVNNRVDVEIAAAGGGGGGGETNTASNVGTGGVGVYKEKIGVDLRFKKINAGSNKITVTDDTGNSEIDINVAEANLAINNIGGTLGVSKGGTGANLSATGGTGQYLKQASTGGAVSVGIINASDLPAHVHTAANITDFNEAAQDAIGTIFAPSASVLFAYNDTTPNVVATVVDNSSIQKVQVAKGGVLVGNRKRLNLIEGANVTLTVTDDAVADEMDITIATTGGGGGSGEANTASNVGTGGVGVFKQKSGIDLQFKKINAGSAKVTITDDTTNSEVDIDVAESSLTLNNIGGTLGVAKGGLGASLAATGGSNKFLRQPTTGGAVIVGSIASSDLPTHSHSASDITTGTLSNLRTTGDTQQTPNTLVLRKSDGGFEAGPLFAPSLTNGSGTLTLGSTSGYGVRVGTSVISDAATRAVIIANGTYIANTGEVIACHIAPIYNQSFPGAGTSNTDLWIERTETAIGNGNQYIIRARNTGTEKFNLFSNGSMGVYPTYAGNASAIPQVTIQPQYLQSTSGTGGGIDLLLNRYETTIGSGVHKYLSCQTGVDSEKAYIDRTGAIYGRRVVHAAYEHPPVPATGTFTPNCEFTENRVMASGIGITVANPSGTPIDGQLLILRIKQDTIGNRTITSWGSNYRFNTDIPSVTLSSGVNKADALTFKYYAPDTKWDIYSLNKGW